MLAQSEAHAGFAAAELAQSPALGLGLHERARLDDDVLAELRVRPSVRWHVVLLGRRRFEEGLSQVVQ